MPSAESFFAVASTAAPSRANSRRKSLEFNSGHVFPQNGTFANMRRDIDFLCYESAAQKSDCRTTIRDERGKSKKNSQKSREMGIRQLELFIYFRSGGVRNWNLRRVFERHEASAFSDGFNCNLKLLSCTKEVKLMVAEDSKVSVILISNGSLAF